MRVLPLIAMLMPNWMDPEFLLNWLGDWALWGTAAVIFIECGLLFPILPGDSLLFAVGLFIALGTIGVPLWLACVRPDGGGVPRQRVRLLHRPGARAPRCSRIPTRRFLKPKYLEQTHAFFDKYGTRALVMARFVPIVRTFITRHRGRRPDGPAPVLLLDRRSAPSCGAPGVTVLGHALGRIDFIHDNLETALILIVLVSVIPMIVEYVLARRRERARKAAGGDSPYDEPAERTAVMDKVNND